MNHDELHSLTLVVSTARSGSSLLCRDLESLGGLGFPKEYMTGLDDQARELPVSETDVVARMAKGCQDDAPGVAATKLMCGQAGFVYEAIAGRPAETRAEAMSGVISWARQRFDRVLLVFLVRNVLDQAISRVVARSTGVFHSTDPVFRQAEGDLPLALDDINQQILYQLAKVFREREDLLEAYAAHADLGLLVRYDELAHQADETARRVIAQARSVGLEVQNEVFTRKLSKVISNRRSAELRASFLDYLQNETGIDPEAVGESPIPVPALEAPSQ